MRKSCPKTDRYLFYTACFILVCSMVSIDARENYDVQLQQAGTLRTAGDYKEALSLYELILTQNPDDVDALLGRGICRIRSEHSITDALADFDKVIGLAPTYVDAYVAKASALYKQGKDTHAAAVLEQCMHACSEDSSKLAYLALECWRIRAYPQARHLEQKNGFKRSWKTLGPFNTLALEGSGSLLHTSDTWGAAGLTYTRSVRPDCHAYIAGSYQARIADWDYWAGVGFRIEPVRRLGIGYTLYISDSEGFLAQQSHNPNVSLLIGPSTNIGVGGLFAKYTTGWLRFFRVELGQTLDRFLGRYVLIGGLDNYNQQSYSHLFSLETTVTEKCQINLGGSYGHESHEMTNVTHEQDVVTSLFASTRVRVISSVTIVGSITGEWRKSAYFRSVFSLAPVLTF